MDTGTPREVGLIAEQVLAWVEQQRREDYAHALRDDVRRVELCALATQEQVLLARWLGLPESG